MQDPRRCRNIALLFLVSGLVAVPAASVLPGISEGHWLRACLFIYGSTAVIFGGGTALFRHLDARAKEKLARGEDVICRWRIEPEAWREFVVLDQTWRGRPGNDLPNELSFPREIPSQGIEVVIGRKAVQVGESIHRLSSGMPEVTEAILHDLHPAVIEMYLYYPGGGHGASGVPHSPKRSALRFPVASGAWKEAQSAIAQYRGDTPRRADFFDGKGDGSDPEDLTQCYHCGYETFKLMSHCPWCGRDAVETLVASLWMGSGVVRRHHHRRDDVHSL